MTIPDEAVQAMPERIYAKTHGASTDVISGQRGLIGGWNEHKRDGQTEFVRADLAAPLLQGVKVRALEWEKADDGIRDRSQTVVGWYFISNPREGQYNLLFDNEEITALFAIYDALEAAKDAAQADYEARILSALEPFANSYPQGANLAAHSKNENGPDHEPSPRAQALEEAALERSIERWRGMKPSEVMKGSTAQITYALEDARKDILTLYSALSSQPVADPLPTHRHKKRGTEYAMIGVGKMQAENWQVSKDGFDQSIDMEEVAIYRSVDDGAICVRPRSEFEDGRFETLPASPEVSE